MIFNNLPLGITGTLIGDVSYFCLKVLNISVTGDDLKACHPLYPVKDFNGPPPIIAKFIRFDKKSFVNPCNNKAESRGMIVSTWNSTPFVKVKDIGGNFNVSRWILWRCSRAKQHCG